MYDCIIIGAGAAGTSCALMLGSAHKKPFVTDKKIALFTHQKGSMLQKAKFNNYYGIELGTTGEELLQTSLQKLSESCLHIEQIADEKVTEIHQEGESYKIITNQGEYFAKNVVVATNHSSPFTILGVLESLVEPHGKSIPEKNRIQIRNDDHKVLEGLYVAGTLAGHRSQLAIAVGSGAAVATDILVKWNDGNETQVHDSINK
ncbi:FAD-dependent oxidoreductase [Capnocytophaga sp. ARDL2]|uniref:FAD-dependent oxidoreductase n=1 Tax=Capnocytophaga sp. ARDL2 TaxID=3238809 RepID=UPI0035593155